MMIKWECLIGETIVEVKEVDMGGDEGIKLFCESGKAFIVETIVDCRGYLQLNAVDKDGNVI